MSSIPQASYKIYEADSVAEAIPDMPRHPRKGIPMPSMKDNQMVSADMYQANPYPSIDAMMAANLNPIPQTQAQVLPPQNKYQQYPVQYKQEVDVAPEIQLPPPKYAKQRNAQSFKM